MKSVYRFGGMPVRVSQSLLGFQPEALLAHPDLTSGHVDQLDQRGPYRLQ